jgi:hypothetical protein
MQGPYRPIAELPDGHYAVGLGADGTEADIYRAGDTVLDVATGRAAITAAWRPREQGPAASGNLPLTRERADAHKALHEIAQDNPIVAEALRLFPGAELSTDSGSDGAT